MGAFGRGSVTGEVTLYVSMTTMASSTTRPVARVMPKRVSELMEKPKILMKAKVPMSETGMVTAGMMVARQSCRKRKMTMTTMMTASPMVLTTSLTDSLMTRVVSTAMTPFRPGRIGFFEFGEDGAALLVDVECVAVESCLNTDADRFSTGEVVTLEFEVGIVVFCTNLSVSDVFEKNDSTGCTAVFDDEVFKLPWIGKAALNTDGHLEGLFAVGWLLAELAGGDLYVLLKRERW